MAANCVDTKIRHDIIFDIMPPGKLAKIRRFINGCRGSSQKAKQLEHLAQRLGRARSPRGKEPTWISEPFPHLRPLSIPHHSSDVRRGTVDKILDHLEAQDVAEWEQQFMSTERDNSDDQADE